ncbi:transcription elongation factor GreB [Peredibacter starrii]|uniref:Transcription elongation factor GreB n=1 Tax=Peredibacter starrii TaxID=28202 RepID=A0AAX4HSX3_9BACT|nr:transcription elongation factor GreB [Peredibacter starrii]WPU66024.1 transcription elongation factor GreB [Peredibacter starrii]
MEKNNYITPKGHQKLVDELDQLLKVERPEVTRLVQWAASNGDRSENADYLYGKRRLREIDRRVRFLSKRLDAAVIVDPLKITSDKIQFGATVEVTDEDGNERRFTIVGVDEVDTAKGRISWQSPIGKTLLGKNEGDEVIVKVPAGEITYEVVSITYKSID